MDEFIACFSEVCDPREDNVRHNLHEVLIIALCTMLCGGEDRSDMAVFGRAKRPFLRPFLRLKHGIPSHDHQQRQRRRGGARGARVDAEMTTLNIKGDTFHPEWNYMISPRGPT